MVDYMSGLSDEEVELKLHDETIQALFGIGLRIEYCIALVDDSPDQAKASLDGTISDLSELISDLRDRIDRLK
jgi:signal transduction histidine kinase